MKPHSSDIIINPALCLLSNMNSFSLLLSAKSTRLSPLFMLSSHFHTILCLHFHFQHVLFECLLSLLHFLLSLTALCDIWYVCAWMHVCTYINQVKHLKLFFSQPFVREHMQRRNIAYNKRRHQNVSFSIFLMGLDFNFDLSPAPLEYGEKRGILSLRRFEYYNVRLTL